MDLDIKTKKTYFLQGKFPKTCLMFMNMKQLDILYY